MPPRLRLFTSRSLALRPKPRVAKCTIAPLQRRYASDNANLPVAENRKGPNQEQLPHVSEEAAAMGEVMGETSPDIEEHGTPVQEVRVKEHAHLRSC
jgi:small subunit ribosomal protein S7